MAARALVSKEILIELLVHTLAKSTLREVVAPEALRTVLASEYHEMVRGDVCDLQPLWDLLAAQPGFEPKAAYPPLLYVKSLEPRLGLRIELPREVGPIGATERETFVALLPVKRDEIEKILAGTFERGDASASLSTPTVTGSGSARASRSPGRTWAGEAAEAAAPPDPAAARRRRLVVGAVSGAVALASLIVVVVTLAGGSKLAFRPFDVRAIAGSLPATSARAFGAELHVVVSDARWWERTAEEREADLAAAFAALPAEFAVLVIEDEQGRPKASVQRHPQKDAPYVRFYR